VWGRFYLTYVRCTALKISLILKLNMSDGLNPCKLKQMKESNVDFTDITALYCTKTGQMVQCCHFMLTNTEVTFCWHSHRPAFQCETHYSTVYPYINEPTWRDKPPIPHDQGNLSYKFLICNCFPQG